MVQEIAFSTKNCAILPRKLLLGGECWHNRPLEVHKGICYVLPCWTCDLRIDGSTAGALLRLFGATTKAEFVAAAKELKLVEAPDRRFPGPRRTKVQFTKDENNPDYRDGRVGAAA